MLRAWDHTKLRVDGWGGPSPETDDEIVTSTGRRYRILETIYRGERLRSLFRDRAAARRADPRQTVQLVLDASHKASTHLSGWHPLNGQRCTVMPRAHAHA